MCVNENQSSLPDTMKYVVTVLTVLAWLSILAFSLSTILVNWPQEARFLSITEKVLLPLLKLSIVAVLSYVFGKPVVDALARRLG